MPPPVCEAYPVTVQAGDARLDGTLALPAEARAIIVFAHGSGSSRHSPRNIRVADRLHERGFGTLLFDLLTRADEIEDDRTGRLRFDIAMLAGRLTDAVDWLGTVDEARGLHVGLFGASTGAAAALAAAADRREVVDAVVSRGGRPDLAGPALARVQVPTLLIVGGRDGSVFALNRQAMSQMRAIRRLEVVAGATHLFEEPGALDAVARLAADWFARYLG